MPIKGLTDQQAALPIIGTLRKGDEKPERGPGKDLTYFRFTADDPATVQQFYEAYGLEPRQINVFLPFKTTDENMDSWIEKWVAGGLEYRSDGETVVLCHVKGGYSTDPRPDPQPEILEDGKRADGSMQVGRLSVIVPEMGRLATVTVLTTSKHDIINLTRQLRSIEAISGDLRGIPFALRRSPKTISTPDKKSKSGRSRREKWLLSIETHKRGTMALLGNMERNALAELAEYADDEPQVIYQLPAGVSSPFEDDITPGGNPPPANGKPASTAADRDAAIERNQAEAAGQVPKPAHPARPMSPEDTRQFIVDMTHYKRSAMTDPDAPASDKARGLFVGKLTEVFAPHDDADNMRRSVVAYLFGADSSTELTKAEVSAGLDWLIEHKTDDGDYLISAYAVTEARAIERQMLLDAGQNELPF